MDTEKIIAILNYDSSAAPSFTDTILFRPILDEVSEALIKAGIRGLLLIADEKEDVSFDFGLKFDTFIRASKSTVSDALSGLGSGLSAVLVISAPLLINEEALSSFISLSGGESAALAVNGESTGAVLVRGEKTGDSAFMHGLIFEPGIDHGVGVYEAWDSLGLCYPLGSYEDLAQAEELYRDEVNSALMHGGVRFTGPGQSFISPDSKIGRGTVILPGCIIKGGTVIGENCVIGPNSVIDDCKIAGGCTVNSSQLSASTVGKGVTVGPFAYIRMNCNIGNNVRIGDFVELKNAKVGDNSKLAHLTYVGDAEVGERVNFGCGTVTANYDGAKKHLTVVEDDAFIGCNTNLIAPVRVGKRAYTAAGTTVTSDVPADALAIGRARQIVKPDWAKRQKA